MNPNNKGIPVYALKLLKDLKLDLGLGQDIVRKNMPLLPARARQPAPSTLPTSGEIQTTKQIPLQTIMQPAGIQSCADAVLDAYRLLAPSTKLAGIQGAALLTERAYISHLATPTQISANGSCMLLATKSSWIALNLARNEDWELMPAWLQHPIPSNDWTAIAMALQNRCGMEMADRGQLMGLPVSVCNAHKSNSWHSTSRFSPASATNRLAKTDPLRANKPLVVDLSSLWAGPLCSSLLQSAGARVIKVESNQRPDASREGSPEFFNLMNAGKASVSLDLTSSSGISSLSNLLHRADIVIESSRPRALLQMGIDAREILAQNPGQVWISITAYGRDEPQANWVGFGDDAAIAAGAYLTTHNGPVFIGDALSDPLTGMHAALAAIAYWQKRQSVLIDVSLAAVTRHVMDFSNATKPIDLQAESFCPIIRQQAAILGADTASIIREPRAAHQTG